MEPPAPVQVLPQFTVVVDEDEDEDEDEDVDEDEGVDVDVRAWPEVVWAMTTRMDLARDTLLIEHTPIDYLDFASPVSGLGSKMGMDATNKWPGETQREWGRPMAMDAAVKARMDGLFEALGL